MSTLEEMATEGLENNQTQATEPTALDLNGKSQEELIIIAKGLIDSTSENYYSIKNDVDHIKDSYYKSYNKEVADKLNKHIEEGGEEADFVRPADEFKPIYADYQNRRRNEQKKLEEEQKANLEIKKKLVEDLKELGRTENAHDSLDRCREIQKKWKETGRVPAGDADDLNKQYTMLLDIFYDGLKVANELRDLDFRRNLEEKTRLCEKAEELSKASDVAQAFFALQALHDAWKESGPVARDLREPLWQRFKEASNLINKRNHERFEEMRAKEEQNLVAKTKLCEEVESVDIAAIKGYKDWVEKSEFILGKQEEWKKIGYAPKKDNEAIYERFRSACDKFFRAKIEFFKAGKEVQAENLAKKLALCAQAEALKDSTDWKEATDKFIALQKEWKTIGAVPKKNTDSIWKRFNGACDAFFDRKTATFQSQKEEQGENLKQKLAIIEEIKVLNDNINENSYEELKALIAKWNSVGHVPFKEKDAVYDAYREAIDAVFAKISKDRSSNKLELYRTNVESMQGQGNRIYNERRKLNKQIDAINQQITTVENNMGFFSKSKSAASMIQQMEKEIEKLKQERDVIKEKLNMLDEIEDQSED